MPEEQAKQRASSLAFTVHRRAAELVGPATPTPRETKRLSDLDDLDTLRVQVPMAFFYRGRAGSPPLGHPAGAIRRALRDALVHYYPLAGRLREVEGRKLVVDCNGEGVLFIQADARVRLAELEAAGLRPPFPGMDQLMFDVEGSGGVLGCPLVLIQVTRLLCGGFVFALRINHTMCDAAGILQFMNAVAELARGLPLPTVVPAWSREILEAPMPSVPHRDFDNVQPLPAPPVASDMILRSFTFGASHIAAIKELLSPILRDTTTTFEALAAFIWRARTAALEVPSGEDAVLAIVTNLRNTPELGLPAGYYGNAVLPSAALADAAELRRGSLTDAVALVRLAKAAVTADYVRSTAQELVLRGRPRLVLLNMFLLSDLRRIGFHRLDFGWGEPVFGGPADTTFGWSYFISCKDGDGEDVVALPIVLPWLAMERFAAEMDMLRVSKL